jgi:hypothetical protein
VAVRVLVAATDDAGDPTHAHTVGLCETHAHPELLIVGLPGELCLEFLRHAAALVVAGRQLSHGELAEGLFPSAPAAIRRVGEQHFDDYLTSAVEHYGTAEFAALQIVFPDRAGLYPWDAGADLRMRLVQPVLDGKFRKCRWTCG